MIHSCTVQPHQLCGYRWPGLLSRMAFCQPCKLQVLLGHWGALTRIGCVSDCCQWPTWSILWFVYIPIICWKCSTTVCSPMAGRAGLGLAHPPPPLPTPLPPTHSLISTICDIARVVKKLSQKPAVNNAQ